MHTSFENRGSRERLKECRKGKSYGWSAYPTRKAGFPQTGPLRFCCALWDLDMQVKGLSESNPTSM